MRKTTALFSLPLPLALLLGTAGALVSIPLESHAATACVRDEIQTSLETFINPLTQKTNWDDYVAHHPGEFPAPAFEHPTLVTVVPQEIDLYPTEGASKSGKVSVGLAFRQIWIQASVKRVAKIFSSPAIFQDLYGLDAEAVVLDAPLRARIFKKVPVLSNQDYTLDYETTREGETLITRARLVDDKKKFAARDNLMVVEPYQKGTLVREVSGAYIRSGILRLLGPQVRSITQSELKKVSESARCLAEKDPESTELKHEDARACWKKSQ